MPVSEPVEFIRYEFGRGAVESGHVVSEGQVRLHVNGQELARLMCSPHALDVLALGFLANEGIIECREDVRLIKVCPSMACVDIWLRDANRELPKHGTITSGCGGGITFTDLTAGIEPIASELRVTPEQIGHLFGLLQAGQENARHPYRGAGRPGNAVVRGRGCWPT